MTTSPSDDNAAPDEARDEAHDTPPTDISVPVGDAIPAPVEPGLDQPIPAKSDIPGNEADVAPTVEDTPEPVSEVSKPVGDAIPTPVEPGTDQPLPEKNPGADD
ncbi:hypothetical protein AWB81_02734 [Caballeronia arationis]|jgi:hypothetical protein|uniref:hypothetical protein n=1 Tax=Caballeronia arationis TaxID=1777142 RepID=UPI00074CF8D4|nr:hypothetical protein [Caballeronia arationis]SAK66742.1 hypothetical protein AWB81_02734 [Caballeronia arationis]